MGTFGASSGSILGKTMTEKTQVMAIKWCVHSRLGLSHFLIFVTASTLIIMTLSSSILTICLDRKKSADRREIVARREEQRSVINSDGIFIW